MYLQVKNIEKSFETQGSGSLKVLENINLEVERGQFVSIVGPSGCGKSTLLYLIAGLESPDTGEVIVNGKPIKGPSAERVVVFQEDGLFPWLTVLDNVTYGLTIKGLTKQEAKEKAMEILKLVHLSKHIDSYPHQLSGGMKQRVAIARALVMEPEMLLMDEPFAALDEQTRMVLHRELLQIWRKLGVTIIFITHNIREAVLLSERIIVLATRPGKIKETFTAKTTRDGITPDDVTLYLEQKILASLQGEIEKVLKEEMGDDYVFETGRVSDNTGGDMGSGI